MSKARTLATIAGVLGLSLAPLLPAPVAAQGHGGGGRFRAIGVGTPGAHIHRGHVHGRHAGRLGHVPSRRLSGGRIVGPVHRIVLTPGRHHLQRDLRPVHGVQIGRTASGGAFRSIRLRSPLHLRHAHHLDLLHHGHHHHLDHFDHLHHLHHLKVFGLFHPFGHFFLVHPFHFHFFGWFGHRGAFVGTTSFDRDPRPGGAATSLAAPSAGATFARAPTPPSRPFQPRTRAVARDPEDCVEVTIRLIADVVYRLRVSARALGAETPHEAEAALRSRLLRGDALALAGFDGRGITVAPSMVREVRGEPCSDSGAGSSRSAPVVGSVPP